ncbi:MAG: putative Ig domain-containing protein, partial [Thiohalomonadales bacterium]
MALLFFVLLASCTGDKNGGVGVTKSIPQSIIAKAGARSVTVNWSGVAGASAYTVYWSNQPGVTRRTGTPIDTELPELKHTALSNGVRYYYVITSIGERGESGVSQEVSAKPVVAVPASPQGVVAQVGDGRVTLRWRAVDGAKGYRVYWSLDAQVNEGDTLIDNVVSPLVHNDLQNNQRYYYIVVAQNYQGLGAASSVVEARPTEPIPPAPIMNQPEVSAESVELFFSDVSSRPGASTAYDLYWNTRGNVIETDALIRGITSPYRHTPVRIGQDYYYRVQARNSSGASALSNSVRIQPPGIGEVSAVGSVAAIPVLDSLSPQDGQLSLSWDAVPGALAYNLYWSDQTSGQISQPNNKISNIQSPYTHIQLNNGTNYRYVLSAINDNGESSLSAEASGTPLSIKPGVPAGVQADGGDEQLAIRWLPVEQTLSYTVYITDTMSGIEQKIDPAVSPLLADAGNLSGGVVNDIRYRVEVTATNLRSVSARSEAAEAMPKQPPPVAPSRLIAEPGNAEVVLRWSSAQAQDPTDSAETVQAYRVYYSNQSGVTVDNGIAIPAVDSEGQPSYQAITSGQGQTLWQVRHSGLDNGKRYYYIVTAINVGGESRASNEVWARPQVPIAAMPSNIWAAAGDNQIVLNFDEAIEESVTTYNLYWNKTETNQTGIGTRSAIKVITSILPGYVFEDGNNSNGNTYFFRLASVNAGGESPLSAEISATPQIPPPQKAPQNVNTVDMQSQVSVLWTPSLDPSVDAYVLYWSTDANINAAVSAKISGPEVQPGYLHTGRTNGEVTYYRVAAVNAGGESALSKLTLALPQWDVPGKPSNVTVTAGDNEVFVNWPQVNTATSYNLYWHNDPINGVPLANWSSRSGVVPGTRVTGLNNAQLYHFQLRAQNAGGASVPSDIVSIAPQQATPASPLGLTIAAGDGRLSLNWGTRANETYTLYWSTDSDPANLPIDSGNQISNIRPTYIHREESAGVALSNGAIYRYQLVASNSGGPSLATSEVRASPAAIIPTAPQALRAEARNNEVLLSWLPPVTGSGPYTYTVYWSNTAGQGTSGIPISNLGTAGYRHRGISNEQTYYYAVTATASGLESEASLPTKASPQGQAPGQVVGVWVAAGDRENIIAWQVEARSSQYQVEWSNQVDAGNVLQGTIGSARVQAPETQYTHSPLNNGDTFYYRVSGESNNGPNASLQSGLVSSTVSGTPQSQSNNLPQIQQGALVNVDMDEDGNPRPFSLILNASDNDVGDSLTWRIASTGSASNGTASVIGNNTSATVVYNPNPDYDQVDQFIIEVADGRGGIDRITVDVAITPQNDAPVFNAIADQSHLDGANVTLDTSASDIDNTILAYSVTGLPPGLSIDAVTGQISGVIAATASAGSPYSVSVTVDDQDPVASAQDTVTFIWNVGSVGANPGTSTASLSPVEASIVAGTTVTIIVTARDSSGNSIVTGGENVALTITGANAAGPLAATDNNDGTYTVTYNAQLAGLDNYLLTIDQAGNPTLISGSYNKTIIPAAANAANSISLVPAGPYTTGVPINLGVQVRDVYGNASSATVAYAITGSNPQNLTGIDQGSGLYRVTYTPAQIGTDVIAITVNTTALSNSPFSRTINASSSSAANSSVTIPAGPYIAGQPITLAAQINDINGKPTTGFLTFEIQGANPQTVTGVSQGGGVYRVDYNPTKVGLGTDTITSRVDTVVIGIDQIRNINPGAADITKSLLTINLPNAAIEATAGDRVSVELQVQDAYNNPTAAVVGMRLSGANVQALTPSNPVLGTYTASYIATTQGADTYIVTVDTGSMPSQFIIVNAGVADLANSTLTVTPLGSATTGDTVVIELKLQDGYKNPTTATVVMSVSNANPQNLIPGNPATGTYRASYIPTIVGVDDYNITIDNAPMLLPSKTILLRNIAPTDISLTANSVAENSANATPVGDLAAVDTTGDTHSYSFVAPNNDAGGRFVIIGNQVQVANGTLLDFETNTTHLITIQAQDQGALVFSRDFTINISDVNDVIPVITNTALTPSIPENSTAVAALTVSDIDTVNAPFNYTLTGADAAQFEVVTNNLQFKTTAIPDFELPADIGADNIYNVSVVVNDGVNTSARKDFIVTITNVIEQTLAATNLNAPESFVENDPVF